MPLSVTTPAATFPVSLSTIKEYLKLTDTADDSLLMSQCLPSAVEWIEHQMRRPLISRTMKLTLDVFPSATKLEIPVPVVSAISSVKYYNTAGVLTTLSASSYWTILNERASSAYVVLKPSYSWPSTEESRPRAVEVEFVAGYGSNPSDVPADIRQAILYLVEHSHTIRAPIITGTIVSDVRFTIESLSAAHRFHNFG